jgi:hypothetical protein
MEKNHGKGEEGRKNKLKTCSANLYPDLSGQVIKLSRHPLRETSHDLFRCVPSAVRPDTEGTQDFFLGLFGCLNVPVQTHMIK